MRFISAILLFSACAMCGSMYAHRLGARVRGIRAVILDTKRIQSRMEYSSACIGRILGEMGTSELCTLWSCMSENIGAGQTVYEGWRKAYERVRADTSILNALHTEEIDAMDEFFRDLGSLNINSERQHFLLFYDRMEAFLSVAENEHKTRGKVFRGIGALGGAALAILVI